MSSDLSAEITAIATAALAAFAIVTAAFAYLAYHKQSQEVGLLGAQNEREALERRRDQASRVFIGAVGDPDHPKDAYTHAQVVNASDLPIYDIRFWEQQNGAGGGKPLISAERGVILPGDKMLGPRQYAPFESPADMRLILSFRDAAGVQWLRNTTGVLEEQEASGTRDAVGRAFDLLVIGMLPA